MFLGISEIRHDKARFVLIVAVIALVSYLTYFLTALAYGLATSYTQGVDKWQADGIVLQSDANNVIARSLISEDDFQALSGVESGFNKARLGVSSATVARDDKEDVTLFGVDFDSFIAPNIIDGRTVRADDEVVVSDALKSIGVALGDTLTFTGGGDAYRVVGFTDQATFQTASIVYLTLSAWRSVAADISGMTGMRDDSTISAIVLRYEGLRGLGDGLSVQSIDDFIFTLPGYSAQVATFGTMIGFLIFIASFMLAIFIYILTIQKKSLFGILKAEGIPTRYISRSVKTQIVILVSLGMLVGVILTLITGWALVGKVPFLVQPLFFVAITVLFLFCAAVGGIASVRVVTKIDPVEAIG
jgi:putative ABC transport system permease protein